MRDHGFDVTLPPLGTRERVVERCLGLSPRVELLTAKPAESRWFVQDSLAVRVVAEDGDSVYRRTWDEYPLYTIKLTASNAAGVSRTSFRASSAKVLERRVAAIEATGFGTG